MRQGQVLDSAEPADGWRRSGDWGPVRIWRWVVLVAFLAVVLVPPPASAHVRATTGYSEIRQQGGEIRYELSLEYELVAAAVGMGDAALNAGSDEDRRAALRAAHEEVEAYLVPSISLHLDGVQCPGTVEETGVQPRDDVPHAAISLSYECPGSPSGGYELVYGVFSDSDGVVDDHINVVDYELGGERGRFVFDSGHRDLVVGQVGLLSSAGQFVAMGVEHILVGADHVLFVVALLLGAVSFRSVMRMALTFTVAHSVTLGLASLGWVDIPPEVVEPLIALSIAWMAIQVVLGSEAGKETGPGSRQGLLIVFGFGLLHGLGFASTLSFTSDISWQLLASLLTFNVGIEVGQALIISLLFPLLLLVRRHSWSRYVHAGTAGLITLLGLVWFFQRLLA